MISTQFLGCCSWSRCTPPRRSSQTAFQHAYLLHNCDGSSNKKCCTKLKGRLKYELLGNYKVISKDPIHFTPRTKLPKFSTVLSLPCMAKDRLYRSSRFWQSSDSRFRLYWFSFYFYFHRGHPKGTRKRKHNNEKSIKLNIIIQLSHSHNIVNEIKFASPFFQFSDIFCPKSLKVPILI